MTFEELEIKLGKKLNINEWKDHRTYLETYTGGWIQTTAYVDITTLMGPNSIIYENCTVLEYNNIIGNSKVYGNSKILNKVHIYDNVEVFGKCKINGPIRILGNIKIFGNVEINSSILKELNCYYDGYSYVVKGDFKIYDYRSLKTSIMLSNIINGI